MPFYYQMFLADDGNYRESRWFAPWAVDPKAPRALEEYDLPASIRSATGQRTAPFGVGILQTLDASVAPETCEELFTPQSPNIWMGLDGVRAVEADGCLNALFVWWGVLLPLQLGVCHPRPALASTSEGYAAVHVRSHNRASSTSASHRMRCIDNPLSV